MTDLCPSRRAYLGDEPARPVRVDGIPGAAVDLEIRPHDRAVSNGEEVSDIGRLDPVFAKTGVSSPHPRFASRTNSTDGSAKVAFNWYGRSPSLQKRIASKPAAMRISTSRRTDSTICGRATDLVLQRRAGQGRQVGHRDDRLLGPEELL